MTDTNLPDDLTTLKYIRKTSAKLLYSSPNKENTNLGQKVDFLLRAVARLASQLEVEEVEKTKKKPPVKPRTSAERERKIKEVARKYWIGRLNGERIDGKPMTRRLAAEMNGFENEPNILSKKIAWDLCMTKISNKVKETFEEHKGFRKIGEGSKKRLIEFIENATR